MHRTYCTEVRPIVSLRGEEAGVTGYIDTTAAAKQQKQQKRAQLSANFTGVLIAGEGAHSSVNTKTTTRPEPKHRQNNTIPTLRRCYKNHVLYYVSSQFSTLGSHERRQAALEFGREGAGGHGGLFSPRPATPRPPVSLRRARVGSKNLRDLHIQVPNGCVIGVDR